MRGNEARRLRVLLLVVLCVAAHFQGASCRGGGGHGFGGHGGRGTGDGGRWRGGGVGMPWSQRHSAAAELRAGGGVDWRVSGCATIVAAALVRWL
ncbi:hypothetical protein ACQJBY_003223 [Aegilops geniculata]